MYIKIVVRPKGARKQAAPFVNTTRYSITAKNVDPTITTDLIVTTGYIRTEDEK